MELKKISDFEWEIPMSGEMRVSGRVFSSEALVADFDDKCLEQVKNVAKLPGILKGSFAMPDMHMGYGFPIGGVAAFDVDEGVISPGGVGYDINCSVRLLKTNLVEADLSSKDDSGEPNGRKKEILHSLFRSVPSGVGVKGNVKLSKKELDEVLIGGAQWAVAKGYGCEDDWRHIEDFGKMEGADASVVSAKAKGRGMGQLGTLGAGNHFLDVLVVDEVFDEEVAKVFGLSKGQAVILIHCGSRGLGHQVASDYIKKMSDAEGSQLKTVDGSALLDGSQSKIADGSLRGGLARGEGWLKGAKQFAEVGLACAPIKSELGKEYFGAMAAAANFAFANKQIITHFVRENLKHYFSDFKADVVYDVCHNIAKLERHVVQRSQVAGRRSQVEKEEKGVLVMRKGATRSFGPGREEVPEDYREIGCPVLLPGSMGTASYVLVGTKEAEAKSWGSCAHGAGRARSRSEANRMISFDEAKKDMEKRGVFVEFGKKKGLVEESPSSYKDVDEVVRVSHEAGLGRKVAKLRPVMVVIG